MNRTAEQREHDQANARRLRAIWERHKDASRMTQANLAKLVGVSRSTVSQYMNGTINLSADMTLRFAMALKCSPTDIDPSLTALATVPSSNRIRKVPVLTRLSGVAPGAHEVSEVMVDHNYRVFAVSVDCPDYDPIYRMGTTLFVTPDLEPVTGDHILIEFRVTPQDTRNMVRRFVALDRASNKLIVTRLDGTNLEDLNLDWVISYDPVVALHAPRVNRPTRLHPRELT